MDPRCDPSVVLVGLWLIVVCPAVGMRSQVAAGCFAPSTAAAQQCHSPGSQCPWWPA